MATIHTIATIVSDPKIHDGQPIIVGTTLRVSDLIASHIYRGLSAEELALNDESDDHYGQEQTLINLPSL